MQTLKWVTGKWQGTVAIKEGDGSKQEYQQTVKFTPKLKSAMLLFTEAANRGQDTVFQNIGCCVTMPYDLNTRFRLIPMAACKYRQM
jgi:hypothetical protein